MSASQDTSHIALATVYEIAKILSSSLALNDTLQQVLNVISSHF